MSFRALVADRDDAGQIFSAVRDLDESQLPEGDVVVDVEWAGLNYKDGLCLTRGGGLVWTYPHVAGIDFAGVVLESLDPRYKPGDRVALTGWRVGEAHWGGYAERARVKADWLVPLPAGLSPRQAMIVGTAGLTAMLSIARLEAAGLAAGQGEVLVTGAAGGVGSIAIALLSRLGYTVAALSGLPEQGGELRRLGASTIIDRDELLGQAGKPLESARWVAAIDSVGGKVLSKLLKQIKYGGAVAALGNAGGIALDTNVLPFILRGVSRLGIDSVMQPFDTRIAIWARIARAFDFASYSDMVGSIRLDQVPEAANQILAGQIRGRAVVDVRQSQVLG